MLGIGSQDGETSGACTGNTIKVGPLKTFEFSPLIMSLSGQDRRRVSGYACQETLPYRFLGVLPLIRLITVNQRPSEE